MNQNLYSKYPYEGKGCFSRRLAERWIRFWMRYAGHEKRGRLACRLAVMFCPPYKSRVRLASMNKKGFIEPSAIIHHPEFYLGDHCFIGDRVALFERRGGGKITFGKHVEIYRDTIIETGQDGYVEIGDWASIHPNCFIFAYLAPVKIGSGVMIAPRCSLFSYNHGLGANELIRKQAFVTKGPILIGDEAWIGVGSIVLSGVSIGKGAVIGAGSVVMNDIPDNAIAAGNPARVLKMRHA